MKGRETWEIPLKKASVPAKESCIYKGRKPTNPGWVGPGRKKGLIQKRNGRTNSEDYLGRQRVPTEGRDRGS